MIVVVAPYSPVGCGGIVHLGAARKIEFVLGALAKIDSEVVLINTAHNSIDRSQKRSKLRAIAGGDVVEVTPSTHSNRFLGKLLNLTEVGEILDLALQGRKPKLVWFYNGYAFEMLSANWFFKRFHSVPMVLEFEDWHFSRSRGINPKPFIDYLFWRLMVPKFRAIFAVNDFLLEKSRSSKVIPYLFPGVVSEQLASVSDVRKPFSSGNSIVNIGFFGGLSVEKGGRLLLELVGCLPENYVLHVTGSGPLSSDFEMAASNNSSRLRFYGAVSDSALMDLVSQCDVILNPHSPIENMGFGVFPFKVIEAISSGRLLISTQVPAEGLRDCLSCVVFVEFSVAAFRDAIVDSRKLYFNYVDVIERSSSWVNANYSEDAFVSRVKALVDSVGE